MTDAYFYVNIPYHRPAPPSFFRLLQRWTGPLLLGSALAALAWHQDHQTPSPASGVAVQAAPAVVATQAAPAAAITPAPTTAALTAEPVTTSYDTPQAPLATSAAPVTAAEHAGAHPALVFHNCSMPRMEVKKDRNDLITGVASVSSCDEAKVTLWDSSR